MNGSTFWILAIAFSCAIGLPYATAQELIFSGPQVGERLLPFSVRGVFDQDAGAEWDLVTKADGKPIVLIFVHDTNRQSIRFTNVVTGYAMSREEDGLKTGVVFLHDDPTVMEMQLIRMRHALTPKAPMAISMEGREGPGSYGLNRNVTLTILIGKNGKVTSNFALIQPSLPVDLPKVLQGIVEVAGGEVPKLSELPGMEEGMMRGQPIEAGTPNLRPLLAPLIRIGAKDEDVDKAALTIETKAAQDSAIRREIARIADTIIRAGKLENYGTAKAQEYLKKWAKEFPKPQKETTDQKDNPAEESPKEP